MKKGKLYWIGLMICLLFTIQPTMSKAEGEGSKITLEPLVTVNEEKDEDDQFPLAYPFSSWGEIRLQDSDIEESLIGDGYFEQGVDWAKLPFNWTLNTFAGLRFTQSNDSDHWWNNKVGPWFGVKVKHSFTIFPASWGEVALGVRGEYYKYTNSTSRNTDFVEAAFGQWSFGGDWNNLEGYPSNPDPDRFPLGYPFSSWGEIRLQNSDIEESLIADGYLEQGVDLVKLPLDLTLNTFVGLRFTQSNDKSRYWNNKVGPWFGVKVKRPFELFPGSWGEIAIGVRGEYYQYTSNDDLYERDNDFVAALFLQWSFGGDWKNF